MASKKTVYAHNHLDLVSDFVTVNGKSIAISNGDSVGYQLTADQSTTSGNPTGIGWNTLGGLVIYGNVALPEISFTLSAPDFTVNTTGKYQIQSQLVWDITGAPAGKRTMRLRINGIIVAQVTGNHGAGTGIIQFLNGSYQLNVGDTFSIEGLQNNATALDMNGSTTSPLIYSNIGIIKE